MQGRRISIYLTILSIFGLTWVYGQQGGGLKWEEWKGCVFVDSLGNDGDSFRVRGPKGEQVVRLYFVDCPELGDYFEEAPRRMREQARYFRTNRARILEFAEKAHRFTAEALRRPFMVLTANEDARGMTRDGRIFGFVRLWDGRDLGVELLRAGLGRAYGKSAAMPGKSVREMWAKYDGAEWEARRAGAGIWAHSRAPLKKTNAKKTGGGEAGEVRRPKVERGAEEGRVFSPMDMLVP